MDGSVGRRRILAWSIDMLITLGIQSLLSFLGPLGVIAAMAYVLSRDALLSGQSLGKRIIGLQVVGHDEQPCTLRESVLRNVLWILPLVQIVMGFMGLQYLFHDAEGRHWGDRLANTRVIQVPR